MGNVKESLIPYLKKQFKMAKLSFDLYGAVSPTNEEDDGDVGKEKKNDDDDVKGGGERKKKEAHQQQQQQRNVSQVELESSAAPVGTTHKWKYEERAGRQWDYF